MYTHTSISAQKSESRQHDCFCIRKNTVSVNVEQPDTMAVFANAIKEMSELGIDKLEDYLAYKQKLSELPSTNL